MMVLGTALLPLAGCPLCRPSAKPEEACLAAGRVKARCASPAEKWDSARKASCVATLEALDRAQSTDKGFTAARLRDCDGKPACAEATSCVEELLKYAAEHAKPAAAAPK